ncbi:hypothetical protein I4U23_017791 [Adineta vaga]|nr:hypothetical protein I4U23_017791 [Adineta vaga]
MSRTKSNKKKNDLNQSDSDTSIEKYCYDDDSISSSSSSTPTTKSSSAKEPKKMFMKSSTAKKEETKFDDDLNFGSSDENDFVRPGLRRPSNPLAKLDVPVSPVADLPGDILADRNEIDGTPFSTMKIGSDTLNEDTEKQKFFHEIEEDENGNTVDFGLLNKELDLELSPIRTGEVLNSFEPQIHQMSTPLHQLPNDNIVKESLSNELGREMEHNEEKMNVTTTTNKRVTMFEPPTRPTASVDDFSRLAKTKSDALTTTGDNTPNSNVSRGIYGQNIKSTPPARTTRSNIYDSKIRAQLQQKSTIVKNPSKPNTQTPVKKTSSSIVNRPKTAPTPIQENSSKDAESIEQLKHDNEMLKEKVQSIEMKHKEELREVQKENYALKAQISQTNFDGKSEISTGKQREVSELEKLIEGYEAQNVKLCNQIKQLEKENKQIQQSMFNINEKLREELIQTKMLLERNENSHGGIVKKQSSTIVLSDLNSQENETIENQRLKEEIDILQSKLNSFTTKNHQDIRQSFDQKRIKDLERQVKELELINRRRQQSPTTQVGMVLNPLDERNQLTIKLHKAEQALHEKQTSEERLLEEFRILEEKYFLMKQIVNNNSQQTGINDQFEKQIHDVISKNKTFTGQSQLRRENERLKIELEKVKSQQISKPAKSLKRDLETIKLLRTDLERKNDELEKLRALYDAINVQQKSLLAEREREKTRLAIMGNKPYQPDRFTQVLAPAEIVHAENHQLKHLVEKLEHDAQQQYAELMRLKEDRQSAIAGALREKDEEILHLRQQHKLELQTIINEMSNKTTETRVTDLLRKIESQDVTINHLKKLTEHADDNARELAILRTHDDELKATIHRLEQELFDARTYHTPEMKHFQDLQNKIKQLEERWSKRDQITKNYTTSLIKQHDSETNDDVNKLRAIIKQKNREIERFHLELDSMLELLKTLKFQQLLSNH